MLELMDRLARRYHLPPHEVLKWSYQDFMSSYLCFVAGRKEREQFISSLRSAKGDVTPTILGAEYLD